MRADLVVFWALLGPAAGHAIERRDPEDLAAQGNRKPWHPITTSPAFFNLKVEDRCDWNWHGPDPDVDCQPGDDCWWEGPGPKPCLEGYGIRLSGGNVIATPYDRWWDPTVATFFVDEDTSMYTVSKDPLEMYINEQTGQFQYSRVGWLPPKAIGLHFFHTGRNPLATMPSSSFLTWPSTQGNSPGNGTWAFCQYGKTGQFEVFVHDENFASAGVTKAPCIYKDLAAIDANPWRKRPHHWDHHDDHDGPGKHDW